MRLVLVGVVFAIVLGGGKIARAELAWTQKADMPTTRYGLSTSVVGGKIYAIGGLGDLRRVDEYDPRMNTWTKKADMATGREFVSTSVVNEKIYVIGGKAGQPISAVEVYDPITDTWAMQTELPSHRMWLSTSVVDGIIYVIGGSDANWGGMTHLGTVEAYNPATDIWTAKRNMPTGRSFPSTCVVDGKIYAIGGWPIGRCGTAVEAYDPETDTWTRKAPMPTARYLLGTSVLGGKICAIGGWRHSSGGPLYSTVEVYDPETDTWTKEGDIPLPTAGLSTSVVDGNIYVIGGALTTHNGIFVHTSAMYVSDIIIDFNSDGIVDSADMCIMVDHWGENYCLCDVGPMPWGDSIVDVEDLKVLAEHLFEEVPLPPELVAYWRFDEEGGYVAHDSASVCDGVLIGDPVWQPDSGMVDGALQFDGIDDYVETDFVLNPADGAFSAIAWIRGGYPGQAILSQVGGANASWLCTDSVEGCLMTELDDSGRFGTPLSSQACITDGNWHRIALVWDNSYRHLYVDGAQVAKDGAPLSAVHGSDGGLYLGVGSTFAPGSFFSGLIDDVRIYDVALTAEEIAALAQ